MNPSPEDLERAIGRLRLALRMAPSPGVFAIADSIECVLAVLSRPSPSREDVAYEIIKAFPRLLGPVADHEASLRAADNIMHLFTSTEKEAGR